MTKQPRCFERFAKEGRAEEQRHRISVGPGGYEVRYETRIARVHGGDGLGLSALLLHDVASSTTIAIGINDDRVRSLDFGQDGFLDSLAFELLDGIEDR